MLTRKSWQIVKKVMKQRNPLLQGRQIVHQILHILHQILHILHQILHILHQILHVLHQILHILHQILHIHALHIAELAVRYLHFTVQKHVRADL